METVDEEVTEGALDFIDRRIAAGKPFFLWWNSTRMHIWTHLKPESQERHRHRRLSRRHGRARRHVDQLLDKLDDLGIADNTIVMYSTDNGAEVMSWPDGGRRRSAARRARLGGRLPGAEPIRRPGVIEPGTIYNDVFAHEDMLPTLLPRPASPTSRKLPPATRPWAATTRCISTATTCCRTSRASNRGPAQGVPLLDR